MKNLFITVFSIASLISLVACGGGGGGGGGGSSSVYSCSGDGLNYVCVAVNGGGGSSGPVAAQATPFPISTSIQTLAVNGLSATGLNVDPYTQAGTFAVTKVSTTTTFNGQAVKQLRTTTTWPNVSTIVPSWRGYVTPYDLFFDSNNQLYGFYVNGVYGLKTSGIANPASVDDGATGTLGSYNLYSDAGLTVSVGTATLTYSVKNCCDLWSKLKATMKLTLSANTTVNWTLTQGFIVTTSGGISYAGEEFTDTLTKRLYYPTGGY